jgi:hypothetical protein
LSKGLFSLVASPLQISSGAPIGSVGMVQTNPAFWTRWLAFQTRQHSSDIISVGDEASEVPAINRADQHQEGLAGLSTSGQTEN